MSKMPQVNPRNMADKTAKLVGTHALIRQGIEERAAAAQEARDQQDQRLNAQAKLDGRTS